MLQRCSFSSKPQIKGSQCPVIPEPSDAMSCKVLIHCELTLPVPSHQELFEGCGLRGILSARVLSVLPQPSQWQHKSRKAYFALWLLHQKYPLLLPGRLLVEEDAAVVDGRGTTSLFRGCILSWTRVYILLCTVLYRVRGRNYF